MNTHFSNIPGIRQAQVCPALATISRLVYPVAVRDIATNGCLTHTNIDDVGIGGRDSNRTNRCALKGAIGYIFPEDTTIGCFPDTTTRRTKIKYLWMHRVASHRHNPPPAKWADQAPLKRVQQAGIDHWL